jgi:hypothetical protein
MTGRHTARRDPDEVDLVTLLGFRPSPVFPTQPIIRDGVQAMAVWLLAIFLPIIGGIAFGLWLLYG